MTREERKRYNRKWFAVRLVAFVVCVTLFVLGAIGIECLAESVITLTWN